MKKGMYIICLCLTFILTGCGNKNDLSCSKTVKDENIQSMTSTQKVEMHFEKDELITYTAFSDVSLSDDYLEYVEEMYANLNQQYSVIKEEKGVSFESNKDGGKLSSKITINMKEINEQTKSFLNIPESQTKEQMKTYFKELGYTCK